MTEITNSQLVAAYVKLRDMKKEIQQRQKEELAPLNEKMAAIERALLKRLQGQGEQSVKTESGTAYIIPRRSFKPVDWDAALGFILEHGLTHMLERRLAKSALEEYLESNGELPPGVSLTTDLAIGVRRG